MNFMNRLSDYRKQPLAWGLLVLVLLVVAFISYRFQAYSHQQLQEAQHAVATLYEDSDQERLNPAVTQDQLDQAIEAYQEIPLIDRTKLTPLIKQTRAKYRAFQWLDQLGSWQGQTWVADSDTNLEQVENLAKRLKFPSQDGQTQAIQTAVSQAKKDLASFIQAEALIDQLPVRYSTKGYQEDVKAYQDFEKAVDLESPQPHLAEIKSDYLDQAGRYADSLLQASEAGEVEDIDLEGAFASRGLAEHLTGSAIDTRKLVALTFDDGPHPNTLEVLDILDEYEIRATFFVVGRMVEKYPEILQEVARRGHYIGNHSYSHANFDQLSVEEICQETDRTQELIEEATGIRPTYYRTPYGNGKPVMVEKYPDLTPIYWNVDSQDWVSQDAATINQHIQSTLLDDSIVLMHDTKDASVKALRSLIPQLLEAGYVFVDAQAIPHADFYR